MIGIIRVILEILKEAFGYAKETEKHRYRSRLLIVGLISAAVLTSGCKTLIQLTTRRP